MSMLLITPMLVAQNATLSLWEENLEQLSADEEERNWEDELETLSARLQEPVNINAATKRQLEEFPFLTDIQIENILAYVYINGQMQTLYELQLLGGQLQSSCSKERIAHELYELLPSLPRGLQDTHRRA